VTEQHKSLKQIADEAGYPLDAFLFVQRGLDYTVKRTHGDKPAEVVLDELGDPIQSSRHVSGQQL